MVTSFWRLQLPFTESNIQQAGQPWLAVLLQPALTGLNTCQVWPACRL